MDISKFDNNQHKSFDIYHDVTISASISEVFEAVSAPKHLINWWPLKCKGTPEIGQKYNFYFTPEFDWYGEVTECIHNKAFHVKMGNSDSDWAPTSFGFDIEESDGQTLLKFWHVGWPFCNEHFRRSSFCWAILLTGLKNYIEKGAIVPFQDRS